LFLKLFFIIINNNKVKQKKKFVFLLGLNNFFKENDIQKEKWGSVKEFIKNNFHKIEEQIIYQKVFNVFYKFKAFFRFIIKSLR
jgi:hypothetical protein